jgi:N-acetylmuramoyl-L-alanine amidase
MDNDPPNRSDETPNAPDGAPEGASPSEMFIEMMRRAASQRGGTAAWDEEGPAHFSEDPPAPVPEELAPSPYTTPYPAAPEPAPPEGFGPSVTSTQTLTGPPPAGAPSGPLPWSAASPLPMEPQAGGEPIAQAELDRVRSQREQRRRQQQRRRATSFAGGVLRTVLIVGVAALLFSTIITWFTDPAFLDREVASQLSIADTTRMPAVTPLAAAPVTTPNWLKRIGIVSGHMGPENDPGAVCPDGLTEAEINFNVARRVVENLRTLGYTVDLLDEFDARLDNYQAAALVSIHANTCRDYGERVSGFLVAKAAARPSGGVDEILAECIAARYGSLTQLERRTTLTLDMTDYHTFREIHILTPAAIIELGFMFDDRALLTEQPDLLARAITEGVLCFFDPGTGTQSTPEPTPPPGP